MHGGIREEGIVDFSISVNPFQPSFLEKAMRRAERYSKRYNYAEWLEGDFRKLFGDDVAIVAGGTEALHIIGWALLKDTTAIIAWPNYTEYERVAGFSASKIVKVPVLTGSGVNYEKLDEVLENELRISKRVCVFIGNPNNPTGIYTDLRGLIAKYQMAYGERALFVVDEAFVDFVEESELAEIETGILKNAIILRTFTKILGIPGVRVGYVKSSLTDVFVRYRMPWAIGSEGFALLETLLEHRDEYRQFVAYSRVHFANERMKFEKWAAFRSSVNYLLLKVGDVDSFVEIAKKKRIHVRRTEDFGLEGYIRVGLRRADENDLLLGCLEEYESHRKATS